MTCFKPNIRVCNHEPELRGEKSETLKIFGKLREGDLEKYENLNEEYQKAKPWEMVGFKEGFKQAYFKNMIEYQVTPCKQCIGCRITYSKNGRTVAY